MKYKSLIFVFLILFQIQIPVVSQQEDLKVVTTTTIVEDIVKNIASGASVDIANLVGIGVDIHDYQATTEVSQALTVADIVFYLGGGVEEGLDDTLSAFADQGMAFSLFDAVPESLLLEGSENQQIQLNEDHLYDPHFWHDPTLIKYSVEMIRDKLIEFDASNEEIYMDNADTYILQIEEVYQQLLLDIAPVAEEKRFLVTQHNAFQYWANAFGFQSNSLEGISTKDETGIGEIEDMAKYLKENEIDVIFLESTVPDENAQAVIEAAAAIGWTVSNGGTLYSGSLGEQDAITYLDLLMFNTNIIVSSILTPPSPTESAEFSITFLLLPMILTPIIRRKRSGTRLR